MDLLLNTKGENNPIEVVLIGAGGVPITFTVPWPSTTLRRQELWRRNYLAHHDPAGADVSADAVRAHGSALVKSLQEWLADPSWRPIDKQSQISGEPPVLRLSFGGESDLLQSLPWESISTEQGIWRTEQPQVPRTRQDRAAHQPRLLVWVGNSSGLDLEQELLELKSLKRGGQIHLKILEGEEASLERFTQTLAEEKPWDGLVFLGHSDTNPAVGGQLHLADGSWVNGQQLEGKLQKAAERGLRLVMLNSCSGLDLARSVVRFGVPWAVCFREPVPCKAASVAFSYLIAELKSNKDLIEAASTVREGLRASGAAGSGLLLTIVGSPSAKTYSLPLSKRRQFQLRFQATTRQQLWVAAGAVALGAVFDVVPTNPISHYLLDRRLSLQSVYRQTTGQVGPMTRSLPVLVIDQHTDQAVGGSKTPNRISRQTLARLLERTSPQQVPTVAVDVVFDEDASYTKELADVIQDQQRKRVLVGFFGENLDAISSGTTSMPQSQLLNAGVEAFDLYTGLAASKQSPKRAPLRLGFAVGPQTFAGQIAGGNAKAIPADAVLDWSLNWSDLVNRVEVAQLPSLRTPVLLIGSDGTLNKEADDLFHTPSAMDSGLNNIWNGSQHSMPGVIVQAVLAQSIRMQRWLVPISSALAAGLTSALAIALSTGLNRRWERLIICSAVTALAIPICVQLAISTLWVVPLCLPLMALWIVTLVRED